MPDAIDGTWLLPVASVRRQFDEEVQLQAIAANGSQVGAQGPGPMVATLAQGEEALMSDDKLHEPESAVSDDVERSWISRLGPGLIAGAADNDPSGTG